MTEYLVVEGGVATAEELHLKRGTRHQCRTPSDIQHSSIHVVDHLAGQRTDKVPGTCLVGDDVGGNAALSDDIVYTHRRRHMLA